MAPALKPITLPTQTGHHTRKSSVNLFPSGSASIQRTESFSLEQKEKAKGEGGKTEVVEYWKTVGVEDRKKVGVEGRCPRSRAATCTEGVGDSTQEV